MGTLVADEGAGVLCQIVCNVFRSCVEEGGGKGGGGASISPHDLEQQLCSIVLAFKADE